MTGVLLDPKTLRGKWIGDRMQMGKDFDLTGGRFWMVGSGDGPVADADDWDEDDDSYDDDEEDDDDDDDFFPDDDDDVDDEEEEEDFD